MGSLAPVVHTIVITTAQSLSSPHKNHGSGPALPEAAGRPVLSPGATWKPTAQVTVIGRALAPLSAASPNVAPQRPDHRLPGPPGCEPTPPNWNSKSKRCRWPPVCHSGHGGAHGAEDRAVTLPLWSPHCTVLGEGRLISSPHLGAHLPGSLS